MLAKLGHLHNLKLGKQHNFNRHNKSVEKSFNSICNLCLFIQMTLILNDLITAKKKAVQYLDNAIAGTDPRDGILLQIGGLLEDPYEGMSTLQMVLPKDDKTSIYIEFENSFSISETHHKKQLLELLQEWSDDWVTVSENDNKEQENFLMTKENLSDKSRYYKSHNKYRNEEEYKLLIYGNASEWYDIYAGLHFYRKNSGSSTKSAANNFMGPSWNFSLQIWTDVTYKGHPRHETILLIEHSIHKLCEVYETCCQYMEPRLKYIYQLDDIVKKYIGLQDIRRIVTLYHNLHFSSDNAVLL